MWQVTTGAGAEVGAGVGCVSGREEIARVRAARVSVIECKVLSILASRLAIRSSSSVSWELVVSGSGGNGEWGESIFSRGGEGTSGGVNSSSLDEVDREHSPSV